MSQLCYINITPTSACSFNCWNEPIRLHQYHTNTH